MRKTNKKATAEKEKQCRWLKKDELDQVTLHDLIGFFYRQSQTHFRQAKLLEQQERYDDALVHIDSALVLSAAIRDYCASRLIYTGNYHDEIFRSGFTNWH